MGTLGNSIFRSMLGWIRTVSVEIWNTLSSGDGETMFQWIGAHWKIMAAVICLIGLAVDLVVYLFRWQPYRVWRGFFHRGGERPGEDSDGMPQEELPGEEPASESFPRRESLTESAPAAQAEDPFSAGFPRGSVLHSAESGRAGADSWRREKYPDEESVAPEDEWETEPPEEGLRAGNDAPRSWEDYPEEESTTPVFEQAILPRRRRRVTQLFRAEEKEAIAPDQLIDRYAAYRRPVYPRKWQEEEGDSEK